MLQKYWFTFNNKHILPPGLSLGCGITAYTKEDALFIMKENVFTSYEFVQPLEIVENIHISTLDENHIIPNMLPPNNRGVWFPVGYK